MSNFNLNWFGDQVKRQIAEAAADGLTDGAEHILTRSNQRIPHDEGTAERSGQTSIDRSQLIAVVSWDTPYIARLHEHPEYNFQKGREGKFAERTINEEMDKVRDHIANKIRGVAG